MYYDEQMTEAKRKAKNDLEALVRAEQIKKDKPRYAAAMKCAKEMQKAMENIVA